MTGWFIKVVSHYYFVTVMEKRGVGRPRTCSTLVEAMRKMRGDGMSYREIEREMGMTVSRMTVWRYCNVGHMPRV